MMYENGVRRAGPWIDLWPTLGILQMKRRDLDSTDPCSTAVIVYKSTEGWHAMIGVGPWPAQTLEDAKATADAWLPARKRARRIARIEIRHEAG